MIRRINLHFDNGGNYWFKATSEHGLTTIYEWKCTRTVVMARILSEVFTLESYECYEIEWD